MELAPVEHENETDNKTDSPIQARAVGILDTIDALIGRAGSDAPVAGEVSKEGIVQGDGIAALENRIAIIEKRLDYWARKIEELSRQDDPCGTPEGLAGEIPGC